MLTRLLLLVCLKTVCMFQSFREYQPLLGKVTYSDYVSLEFPCTSRILCASICGQETNCQFWGYKDGYCQYGSGRVMIRPQKLTTLATIGKFYSFDGIKFQPCPSLNLTSKKLSSRQKWGWMHPCRVWKPRTVGFEMDHLGLRVQERVPGDAQLRQFHPFHALRCVRSNKGMLLEALILLWVCCGVNSCSCQKWVIALWLEMYLWSFDNLRCQ